MIASIPGLSQAAQSEGSADQVRQGQALHLDASVSVGAELGISCLRQLGLAHTCESRPKF